TSDGISYDLLMENNDLAVDETLKTAILVSLLTDRRVTVEELPPEETDQRGWWADALNDDSGAGKDQIGSQLGLLKREEGTPGVVNRAREYCEEALQWMIDDKIAQSITVTTERAGLYQISIGIAIKRPQDDRVQFKFGFIWQGDR